MPTQFTPDDVRLLLTYPARTTTGEVLSVDIEVFRAAEHEQLMTVRLTPAQFASLMSSHEVVAPATVSLTVAAPQPPNPAPQPRQPHGHGWMEVTLLKTSNPFLRTPCRGQLMVNEFSTDGHVIAATFRRRSADGKLAAPVIAPQAQFAYLGRAPRRESAQLCPNPYAHDPDCAETDKDRRGDCDGRSREYTVTGTSVAGHSHGETVALCAAHAQIHGPSIRKATRAGLPAAQRGSGMPTRP